MKKVFTWVFVVLICITAGCSGVYCAVLWFQRVHRESHIIGSLNIDNSNTVESFKFLSSKYPVVLYSNDYSDNELYIFDAELEAVPSFDGYKKQYEIILNDYLILEPSVKFRTVNFRVNLTFRDVDRSVLVDTFYDVSIKFLEDKTEFHIKINGDKNRQYFERYLQFNGFELFINEIVEEQ